MKPQHDEAEVPPARPPFWSAAVDSYVQPLSLPPKKRALLAEWARRRDRRPRPPQNIPRLPRTCGTNTFPLSFAQERLWIASELEPDNATYNATLHYRLIGALDRMALERAINDIIGRHETLRTTFPLVRGGPIQRVSPAQHSQLERIDLSRLSAGDPEAHARELADAMLQRPLDLSRGPLFQVSLLRVQPNDHILLLGMHHIISDGWSLAVFRRELSALYRFHSTGAPHDLPDLSVQYADYAVWQRERMAGASLNAQLAYWLKQFAPPPAPLHVPASRPPANSTDRKTGRYAFALPESLIQPVRTLSRTHHVTSFVALLAGFYTVLRTHTQRTDLLIAVPMADRPLPETHPLIGFFVNTLPFRLRPGSDPTFSELLEHIADVTLSALAHHELPYQHLVTALRSHGRQPDPVQPRIAFTLHNTPRAALELPCLTPTSFQRDTESSTFDLSLNIWDRPESLAGSLVYDEGLFRASTIRALSAMFVDGLASAIQNPDARLGTITNSTQLRPTRAGPPHVSTSATLGRTRAQRSADQSP